MSELVKNGREISSQPEANRGGRPLAPDSNRGRPLAPEANRGRPLAELAFATLSREEQSEEEKNVFGTPRWDIFCNVYPQVRPVRSLHGLLSGSVTFR